MVKTARENASPHGLSSGVLEILHTIFERYPEIRQVRLYGSRARGTHRPGSDIDLAVFAPDMSEARLAALWQDLEASPIAFNIDLVHVETLTKPDLRDHILAEGIPIYVYDRAEGQGPSGEENPVFGSDP